MQVIYREGFAGLPIICITGSEGKIRPILQENPMSCQHVLLVNQHLVAAPGFPELDVICTVMLPNGLAASPNPSHVGCRDSQSRWSIPERMLVCWRPGVLPRSCSTSAKVEGELEQGPWECVNGRYLSDEKLDNGTWMWDGIHNTAGGPRTGTWMMSIAP
jgi:hypothetical protein